MADIAVSARDVSKRFTIHTEHATSFKERVIRRRQSGQDFYALRDVSLEIEHGTTVGLIGPNGSGKSTLLKVLAGIMRPTSGTVIASGRIASLLELGAGFNGELTGRENVFLNASLLGLTRRETEGLFDSIVEFAELAKFIDNPVKHYSSGMYVRLGFAVAVHVDPDILLVDEVLTVGDEHFQRKCMAKISDFQRDGRTILFVTHSLDQVEAICRRGIVLNQGRVTFDGDPYFAAEELRKIMGTDVPAEAPDIVPDPGIAFGAVVFSSQPGGPARTEFTGGEPLVIRVPLRMDDRWVEKTETVQVVIMGVGEIPIWSMTATRPDLPKTPGNWALDFVVAHCPLLRGRFVVATQLADTEGQPMAATRTSHAFGVESGQQAGLLRVDYQVRSTESMFT